MADEKIKKGLDDNGTLTIDYRQIGATGLKRFSGFIYEEFLQELTGQKGMAVYKEMGWNDSVIGSFLYAIEHICRKVPWRVEPASKEPFDLEAAEFLEQCMDDMDQTWIDTVADFMSMLQYGYSVHEINYKRRCGDGFDPTMRSKYSDGRIGWRGLPIRSQDSIYRWQFDDHGGIQGVEQLAPPHYFRVTIPTEKFLLFRTTIHKNNPEGKSVLRSAYKSWYTKKNLENIEAIGLERELAGLPIMKVPGEILSPGASPDQQALATAMRMLVTNIRQDEQMGILIPSDVDAVTKVPLYELSLLNSGGTRAIDISKTITRYDQRIAMSVLADFLMLGHDGVGSHALGSDKIDLFVRTISSFLDIIAQILNRVAIPRLFALNDFQISDFPKIVHGDTQNVNLKEIGDYLKTLTDCGMPIFPNQELEKYLMKVANLPEPIDPTRDIEQQVTPRHLEDPEAINEIPDDPIAMPHGLDVPNDTTPVNPQPKQKLVTNNIGNTEHAQSFLPGNKDPDQRFNRREWGGAG